MRGGRILLLFHGKRLLHMMAKRGAIPAWVIGEFIGTFILVFFGCGSVCSSVMTGSLGLFEVALVWGLAVATAVYLTASLSGAHLNPAVTISIAAWSDFPKSRVAGYIAAQMAGAFLAAAILYVVFGGAIAEFEAKNNIVRGEPGSEASAMVFGEYFPNPQGKPLSEGHPGRMSQARGFVAEVVGTGLLLLVIFCTTDENNHHRPQVLTPLSIGLTITMLIALLGPLTMACFNPARDFVPRLFSSLMGWGSVPFAANGTGWLTVYIIAPILGGLLGGAVYRAFFRGNYAFASK